MIDVISATFSWHILDGRNIKKSVKNSINSRKINVFKTHFSRGAKHSPSPSPLGRPSADFWHPRATAWFWPFDHILLIEISNHLTNPQTDLEIYIRALTSFNMSLIGPREGSVWRGNVSKKMSKKWWTFWKFRFFQNWFRIKPEAFHNHQNIKKWCSERFKMHLTAITQLFKIEFFRRDWRHLCNFFLTHLGWQKYQKIS